MKLRKLKAATAMGSLTATVALLAGMSGAQAQGAGSYPGSILIPGTNTSFSVGGYVKGDYFYDFSAIQGLVGGTSPFSEPLDADGGPGHTASGGHNQHGRSQMTASQSRFNIQTRTPTAYGEVKTFLEGDFTNPNGLSNGATLTTQSNSTGLRLRHAYGTIGPWLVGQTWGAFQDLNAEGETLDFGGDNVPGTTRVPQLRYTYDAGNGLSFWGSMENPQSIWADSVAGGANTSFGTGQQNKIPDFIVGGQYMQPWGHLSLRGVFRDLYDHNGSTVSTSEFGWGLALGGDLHTWGKDDLQAQVWGGDGLGRYTATNCGCYDFAVNAATNTSETVSSWGAFLAYQHFWAPNLRSNASGSYVQFDNDHSFITGAGFDTLNRRVWTAHVNLIWDPVPSVSTGIEYIWGQRKVENGQTGVINRFQASAQFKF